MGVSQGYSLLVVEDSTGGGKPTTTATPGRIGADTQEDDLPFLVGVSVGWFGEGVSIHLSFFLVGVSVGWFGEGVSIHLSDGENTSPPAVNVNLVRVMSGVSDFTTGTAVAIRLLNREGDRAPSPFFVVCRAPPHFVDRVVSWGELSA